MVGNFNKKLGKKIKLFREQTGLSQNDLAKRLKIGRVAVSNIENGARNVSPREMVELCRIFDITSDLLLDLEKDITVILDKTGTTHRKPRPAIRINVPQKNLAKFKEILLCILNRVSSKPNVGESVLYKLLYFIDFDYYEKYEEQLIGATYIKNRYGPTPKEFAKIVKQMEDKDLKTVERQYFKYPQRKYLPLRKPDLSKLNARELQIIDSVLERLSDKNAVEISEYSHNDVPWLTTEDGKVIEYESVFYRTPAYSVRPYNEEDIQ